MFSVSNLSWFVCIILQAIICWFFLISLTSKHWRALGFSSQNSPFFLSTLLLWHWFSFSASNPVLNADDSSALISIWTSLSTGCVFLPIPPSHLDDYKASQTYTHIQTLDLPPHTTLKCSPLQYVATPSLQPFKSKFCSYSSLLSFSHVMCPVHQLFQIYPESYHFSPHLLICHPAWPSLVIFFPCDYFNSLLTGLPASTWVPSV